MSSKNRVRKNTTFSKRFKFSENPYSLWDTAINPRYFIWQAYKEPSSYLSDERNYSNRLVEYLDKNAEIIEDTVRIEDSSIRKSDMDDDDLPYSFGGGQRESKKYLYKDNLICVSLEDNLTYSIEIYKPISKKFVHKEFAKWVIEYKGDSKVSILVTRGNSIVASKVSFAPPKIDNLELNYGSNFNKAHEKIVEKLNARNGKMFILSGCPGSGKSTYIKYLTSIIDREFIFIPVNMTDRLSSPDFISILMSKKEAVLILEDAEKSVQQRGGGGDDSAVATLLNLSDGILGTLLNISIVVTFNAEKNFIDKALLRKGRLAYEYHFGPLKVEDAQKLAKHLNKEVSITEPMTLADIYNAGDVVKAEDNQETNQETTERQIGFHTLIKKPLHEK